MYYFDCSLVVNVHDRVRNRPIGPWPIRSLELSLLGPFVPWPVATVDSRWFVYLTRSIYFMPGRRDRVGWHGDRRQRGRRQLPRAH